MEEDRNPGKRSEGPFSRREEGWELGEEKESKSEKESKRKQKRKPLALAQKLYEDNCLRIHEILATKVERTLALYP